MRFPPRLVAAAAGILAIANGVTLLGLGRGHWLHAIALSLLVCGSTVATCALMAVLDQSCTATLMATSAPDTNRRADRSLFFFHDLDFQLKESRLAVEAERNEKARILSELQDLTGEYNALVLETLQGRSDVFTRRTLGRANFPTEQAINRDQITP